MPLTILPSLPGVKRRVMQLKSPSGELLGYFPRKRFEAAIAGLTINRAAVLTDPTLKPRSWIVVEGVVNSRVTSRSVIYPMQPDDAFKLMKADDEKDADKAAIVSARTGKAILFQPRNAKNELLEARQAWPVVIEGFEDLLAVVHKIDGCWAVSEVTTGARIAAGVTKPKAIAEAIASTKRIGLEKAMQAVADYRAKLPTEVADEE